MNYFKQRLLAFSFAFAGLRSALKKEAHVKLHLIAGISVIGMGIYTGIQVTEWIALFGCIALVLSLELINSAIEQLCNLVMPGQHPEIKYIKDVSAAAVLVACIFSVIVAVLVFWPHIH